MANGHFKILPRRIASNKTLHDKAFNIHKNLKYDEYQRGIVSLAYKPFYKIFWLKYWGGAVRYGIMLNQELAEKLDKPILKNRKYTHHFGKPFLPICH